MLRGRLPRSERALEEARRLGGFGAGRLTIVHVAEAPIIYGEGLGLPPEDEIADVASAWLRETALGIDGADSVLLSGHAGSAACAWARRGGVDLLVAGAHRGRLARLHSAASPATSRTTRLVPCSWSGPTRPDLSTPAEGFEEVRGPRLDLEVVAGQLRRLRAPAPGRAAGTGPGRSPGGA